MKKVILTFGLISGVLSTLLMIATLPFLHHLNSSKGYAIGYTGMVLSFLLVFFGIRSFRDNVHHGAITFGQGFAIGLGITLISCVFYVVTWEIIYFNFMQHSMDSYFAQMADKVRSSGTGAASIQAQLDTLNRNRALYQKPLYNAAFTFIEPFPVGLIITLISAIILKRKSPSPELPSTAPASA